MYAHPMVLGEMLRVQQTPGCKNAGIVAVNGSVTKNVSPTTTTEKKKRRRKKKPEEEQFVQLEPPKPHIVITQQDNRNKTLWRHIIWLIVLFAYSLLGGLIFSAIEG
ncbi:unnamed protein product [Heligmosomoides polygyrus]|uniref:Uncharacterized protein n=1 Tax=Heligmosomoides polygyrus TaxID=6339 RepID=A0A183G2E0_HELPZ|nr:unnamed protein product [Heligmosomoides polygyrus]